MKYLIVSDIHGSLPRLEQVLDFYKREHYDMLLILGDIVNYGPRNGLPDGLDPMGIVNRLNEMADQVMAIRGNCDAEVDQMLLKFPIMADYALLVVGTKRLFLTHGHKYKPDNRTSMGIDAFLYGHTHLCELRRDADGTIICNTGSITFPKGGNPPTFATLDEDQTLRLRLLDGTVTEEMKV